MELYKQPVLDKYDWYVLVFVWPFKMVVVIASPLILATLALVIPDRPCRFWAIGLDVKYFLLESTSLLSARAA